MSEGGGTCGYGKRGCRDGHCGAGVDGYTLGGLGLGEGEKLGGYLNGGYEEGPGMEGFGGC